MGEALKFGLGPVLGPRAGDRIDELAVQPSLRAALGTALPGRQMRRAA